MPYFPPVLLRSGAVPGATVQAQEFIVGTKQTKIIVSSDGTSAFVMRNAADTSSILTVDTTNGRLAIGSASGTPQAALHIVGNNGTLRLSTAETDATPKSGSVYTTHYTTAEEPVIIFRGYSDATANLVSFGGGTTLGNAATIISFFTAANNTTPTGTERMRISADGYVGVNIIAPTALLHVGAPTTARASLCLPHGAAPTSPVNGDMWTTTAGLFVRINGVTVGPLS